MDATAARCGRRDQHVHKQQKRARSFSSLLQVYTDTVYTRTDTVLVFHNRTYTRILYRFAQAYNLGLTIMKVCHHTIR